MIVKNEEEKISRCLSSVVNLVKEIIVVDTGSEDSTKEIAASFGAKLYDFKWTNDFAEARNYAIQQSTSDWNLILDADEWITKWDTEQVVKFTESHQQIGCVRVMDKFLINDEISYSSSISSRLIPKGVFYTGRIHEQIDSSYPKKILPIEIHHDGYYMTDKTERNLELLLAEFQKNPLDSYVAYQIAREYRGRKDYITALQYFEHAYKLLNKKENYAPNVIVDYIYCMINSKKVDHGLHVIQAEQNDLDDFPDFHFVTGLYYTELILSNVQQYASLLPLIEQSYKRAIQIGETDQYQSVIGTGSFAALYNLGVYYEITGNLPSAIECYKKSAQFNYEKAVNRLKVLNKS